MDEDLPSIHAALNADRFSGCIRLAQDTLDTLLHHFILMNPLSTYSRFTVRLVFSRRLFALADPTFF
jgi:hypothetical protein